MTQTLLQQQLNALVPLTNQDWSMAMPHFRFLELQPNDMIFTVHDTPHSIYFLLSGVGRYFYINNQGKERNKSLVKAGGVFASMSSLVENQPSPFYTQAITPCSLAAVDYQQVITWSEQSLNWATFVRRAFEQLVIEKDKREAGLLLLSARERYEDFLKEFGREAEQIPLYHIAMYLGITDVSLSRIRKEMSLT